MLSILLKGSKLVTHSFLNVQDPNPYQRRSSSGPLQMKSPVVQWTMEAALETDAVTMVTSQRAAASHLGGVTTRGNLCESYTGVVQALSSPKPALRMASNHYHLSLLGLRRTSCVTENLYDLHCTFGRIIEVNQMFDHLQKCAMVTLEYADSLNGLWQTSTVLW